MRQVPVFKQFALLGGGRTAQHFSYYLETLRLPFWVWTDTRSLTAEFFEQLSGTSHLILLVSDAAISEVALRIRSHAQWLMMNEDERPVLLHASGATTVDGMIAAHPLMTFPEGELYPKEFYPRIPITLFSDDPAVSPERTLPGFPNPIQVLPVRHQPLYHALCVVFGNLPQLLWKEADAVRGDRLPLSREIFRPFLEASLRNFLTSPQAALTGPFIRKDLGTIERHLEALKGTELFPLYSAFVEHYFNLNELSPGPESPMEENS